MALSTKATPLTPFIKWAGGKRQLLPAIERHLPPGIEEMPYCEPFLGGGALLLHLQPQSAIVNDVNPELINAFRVIKEKPQALLRSIAEHKKTQAYYYQLRELDRSPAYRKLSPVVKASRFIYLNRMCYNGLYRVNSKGQFNVPIGRYANPTIANAEAILALSRYLSENDIQLMNRDFSELEEVIQPGSFVYIDPPYHPLPNSRSFTTYAKSGFSEEDQQRLKHFSVSLVKKRKCTVLLSNSYTDFILKLYQDPTFEIFEVKANRSINSVSHGRNEISEALILGAPR